MRSSVSRGRATAAHVVGRVARSVVSELLEERRLFATFTVSNLNGNGPGSLWQAVQDANGAAGADVIEFQAGLTGTINTPGALVISDAVDVRGPGADKVTVKPVKDPDEGVPRVLIVDGPGEQVVRVAGLTLTGGSADGDGGGVFNAETLTLDHVVVTKNSSLGGAGGGIANFSVLNLLSSTVSSNVAGGSIDDGGGGVFSGGGDLTVRYSTISNNQSTSGTRYGGGVYVAGGNATFENSTVSGNRQSGSGGGIASAATQLTLRNVTVANNRAEAGEGSTPEAGGGVLVVGGNASISTSIIANNQSQQSGSGPFADDDLAVMGTGELSLVTDSVIEKVDPALGINASDNVIGADPKLGALANNGGPTQTHALLAGSPAIAARFSDSTDTDQRGEGFPRAVDRQIDAGAYQYQGARVEIEEDDQVFDAYVQDGADKNTNFGGPELLVKKSSSTGSNRVSYIKIDLSEWDLTKPIAQATLRLVGHLSKPQDGGVPVTVYAVSNTSWGEGTITFNNKPATGDALSSVTVNSSSSLASERVSLPFFTYGP